MVNPFPCPHWSDPSTWDSSYEWFKTHAPGWDDMMALILMHAVSGGYDVGQMSSMLAIAAEMRKMEIERSKAFIALRQEMREGSPTTGIEGSETPGQRTPPPEV